MIYFIQNLENKAIKIGYSVNPAKRLEALQAAHSSELVLIGTIPGDKTFEAELHERYKRFHIRGEWFRNDSTFLVKVYALIHQGHGPLVKDILASRNDCRYGLQGVRLIHLTSGERFTCAGSEWGEFRILYLYTSEGRWEPGCKPVPDNLGMICLSQIDLSKYTRPKMVRADECALLSEWPVVCCRPRRQ